MNKVYFIKFFLPVIFIFGAFGCSNKNSNESKIELENSGLSLEPEAYSEWIANSENKLNKQKEISDLVFHLSYLPAEYLAYNELKEETHTQSDLDSVIQNYSGMKYFNLKIKLKEGQGELLKYKLLSAEQYNKRLNYISFEMQKDIFLVQGNDTLLSGLYHFERAFELVPYATVMLAFDQKKFDPTKQFEIVIDDHLFDKGYVKFTYNDKQLIDLPNISGV